MNDLCHKNKQGYADFGQQNQFIVVLDQAY